MHGHTEIDFAGVKSNLRCEIDLAPQIEIETGKGVFQLFNEMRKGEMLFTDSVKIIVAALNSNGRDYTFDRALNEIKKHKMQLFDVHTQAMRIVTALIDVPEDEDESKYTKPAPKKTAAKK